MILDKDKSRHGKKLLGIPIKGSDELLSFLNKGLRFIVAVGAVGDNRPRRSLFELGVKYGLKPLSVRHPSAIVSPDTIIEAGTAIFPGVIVNADAFVGHNVIINSGAIVEHDCSVGDHAHIATGAKLRSTVRVGQLAHIGAGAV